MLLCPNEVKVLNVAARKSLLSQAQVKEVEKELSKFFKVSFNPIYLDSLGDLDLVTPLTALTKTDFFTQNIDELVLQEKADFAVHSAKDLPEIIDERLDIIALTSGVDQRDSLVSFKYNLKTLPLGAKVGVCSERRIQALKNLRTDLIPCMIRGPIDDRIEQLKKGHFDAIIIAEAGLIRLNYDIPREILTIPVALLQGRLAIMALKTRLDLKALFEPLDYQICG